MNYAPVSAGINSNDFTALDGHNKYKHGPSQASESDNQERPNAESSTKTVNTTGPVNTATPTYADYPYDPLMLDLEDAGIFDDAYDDRDEGTEADYNNLETGHRQEECIDYDEVFALVARIKAIRLFLAYASFMDFTIYQMDVKSALLYGTIEEEVYVSQPPGFVDPEFPDRVYKVEKALYGLHQAHRAWYETLSTYLLENGFRKGIIDKTLFIKKIKDDILLVQVQDKYVNDILKKFGFSCVKSVSKPMETHKPLSKDANGIDVDVYLYRYLKGQSTLGLWYPKDSPFELIAYSDNDYAGASLDRKSTTGGCQFLGSRLISWQSKKQTIVANFTTEAEYIAASNCYGQVLLLQNQLLDYGYNFM
nr:hypothetical protein [Tanacetum cinerariifolium]